MPSAICGSAVEAEHPDAAITNALNKPLPIMFIALLLKNPGIVSKKIGFSPFDSTLLERRRLIGRNVRIHDRVRRNCDRSGICPRLIAGNRGGCAR